MADDKGIPMIQITNADNMEFMARYPDKFFDLALNGVTICEKCHKKKNTRSRR
jgi:hypothetical protein